MCYTDGGLKCNLKYCHVVSMAKKVSASSQNTLLHINHLEKLLSSFSKILLVMNVKTILSEFLLSSTTRQPSISMDVCMCVVLRQTLASVRQ